MKNKRFFAALLVVVMTVCVCFQNFSPVASAFSDQKGSISLTITDSDTGNPAENVTFRLYFVATAYEKGTGVVYNYVKPYDECNMELGNLQDSYLPIHLSAFSDERSLPYTEKSSDKNGNIVFDNLESGAYLVVFVSVSENDFTISPFVVGVPLYDKENDCWVYDINATPKIEYNDPTDTPEFTYITVKKQWEGKNEHPDSVTVSLFCDFSKVETVTLNADNNWSYRWDNLSKKHSWNVVEENVPDGYVVSYDASANTVVITNEKPVDDETTTQPEEEETKPDELIQTGQLNWPVPVFSIAGLLLFSMGWAMLNLGKKKND